MIPCIYVCGQSAALSFKLKIVILLCSDDHILTYSYVLIYLVNVCSPYLSQKVWDKE